ncbi:MAG: FAD-dependent oxidoreductase [Bacteroidota bacterium]
MKPSIKNIPSFYTDSPLNIVLLGSGAVCLGAFQTLVKKIAPLMIDGRVQLTLISKDDFHTSYGWMQECMTGLLDEPMLRVPVESCFRQAKRVIGSLVQVDPARRQIQVKENQGVTVHHYDHLLIGDQFCGDASTIATDLGFPIQSALDMAKMKQELQILAEKAARSKDKFTAARHLRVTLVGNGLVAAELAGTISVYLRQLCRQQFVSVKPTIYLVTNEPSLQVSGPNAMAFKAYVSRVLKEEGIRVICNKELLRVNTDGAVLIDGSFINCSLVFNANPFCGKQEPGLLSGAIPSLESDRYGHVINATDVWRLRGSLSRQFKSPSSYIYNVKQGRLIGANIAASICGKNEVALKTRESFLMANMGNGHAISCINGWPLFGWLAAFLRGVYMLKYLLPQNRAKILRAIFSHLAGNLSLTSHRPDRAQYKPRMTFGEVAY